MYWQWKILCGSAGKRNSANTIRNGFRGKKRAPFLENYILCPRNLKQEEAALPTFSNRQDQYTFRSPVTKGGVALENYSQEPPTPFYSLVAQRTTVMTPLRVPQQVILLDVWRPRHLS